GTIGACEKYHKTGGCCKTRSGLTLYVLTCNEMILPPPTHSPMLRVMAAGIHDLKVWQEAVALGAEIVRLARQGARRETKVVTDQLMLTALTAAGTIADGYGRYTPQEQ